MKKPGSPVLQVTAKATGHHGYGPFGEVVRVTGPMAKINPLRFSTKYQDDVK